MTIPNTGWKDSGMKESNIPLLLTLGACLTWVIYFQYFAPGNPKDRCTHTYGPEATVERVDRYKDMCKLPNGSYYKVPNQ